MLDWGNLKSDIVDAKTMTPLLNIEDIPLDEGENWPRVYTSTVLSSDLVVSPITRDAAGCQCLVITDLNFGELTNGHMHQQLELKLKAKNYKSAVVETKIESKYFSFGEIKVQQKSETEQNAFQVQLINETT